MARPNSTKFREAQLAAIVENSSDAIVSKGLDGIIQTWNAAAERIFGWSEEEIVGQSIRLLIPADRQAEEDEIIARVRDGEIVAKFETVRLSKFGEEIPLAVTISPIRDASGKVIGASKIANDLREQALLRSELRESQQQFVALAQNIPQLAWMADSKGWIYWYNRRWFEYTGTSIEQMQGWGWRDVHHPEHVDRVVALISKCFETGEEWEDTFPLRRHDGEYRWFLSRANPLKDTKGNVLLWCGTNTDITEQLEATERIKLLVGEVNHRSRNMLAVIQAVASRTFGKFDKDLLDSFSRRISAMAANQGLLTKTDWSGARVEDLARSQMGHLGDGVIDQLELHGPQDLMLGPKAAEALGLALHELATNSTKYGAFSTPGGKVDLCWKLETLADPLTGESKRRFLIDWQESGGPRVTPPQRRGFGSRIIEQNPRAAMGAEARIDFAPEGVHWHLDAPCDKVLVEG